MSASTKYIIAMIVIVVFLTSFGAGVGVFLDNRRPSVFNLSTTVEVAPSPLGSAAEGATYLAQFLRGHLADARIRQSPAAVKVTYSSLSRSEVDAKITEVSEALLAYQETLSNQIAKEYDHVEARMQEAPANAAVYRKLQEFRRFEWLQSENLAPPLIQPGDPEVWQRPFSTSTMWGILIGALFGAVVSVLLWFAHVFDGEGEELPG